MSTYSFARKFDHSSVKGVGGLITPEDCGRDPLTGKADSSWAKMSTTQKTVVVVGMAALGGVGGALGGVLLAQKFSFALLGVTALFAVPPIAVAFVAAKHTSKCYAYDNEFSVKD